MHLVQLFPQQCGKTIPLEALNQYQSWVHPPHQEQVELQPLTAIMGDGIDCVIGLAFGGGLGLAPHICVGPSISEEGVSGKRRWDRSRYQ